MNPDEMSDEQLMRTITLAIAAISGTASTIHGVIANAEVLARYIETGERTPEAAAALVDWGRPPE